MSECVKRGVYRINSRNLTVGVYDGDEGFIGIREKFGSKFLFTEYHWDQGPPFGTVRPQELVHSLPRELDLFERLPYSVCGVEGCWRPAQFVKLNDDGTGAWFHLKGNVLAEADEFGHKVSPCGYTYLPLFEYLEDLQEHLEDIDARLDL